MRNEILDLLKVELDHRVAASLITNVQHQVRRQVWDDLGDRVGYELNDRVQTGVVAALVVD